MIESHYEKYWESNREPEPRGHNYKPEINDRNPNQRTHPPNDYPRANQMNDYEEYEIKRTPIGLSPADRYKLMFLKQTEEQEQIDIIRRKQIRKVYIYILLIKEVPIGFNCRRGRKTKRISST